MQQGRLLPTMVFHNLGVRKAFARFRTPLLLIPIALLLVAVVVVPGEDIAAPPAATNTAMVAAEALAGEFFVLATALP